MPAKTLETDYLVVGCGAAGMAFADALVADSTADVVMLDRRHAPGGHWHDAYPFVRLHQPSAYYGVNSLPLGSDTIERTGPNQGFYERASAPEIVPSVRRGNAWLLESGELDLALGAVVDDAPGIRRLELCTEGFACAVRKGHPDVAGRLSLDLYARLPHLVITLGDDEQPTWIDEALAKKGRSRHVALRTRYFMAAPLVVAKSDLVLTAPAMLIDYFAKLVPLTVLAPPIRLPTYPEEAYWHERYDSDPGHQWLRGLLALVTAKLGTGKPPERRRFERSRARQRRAALRSAR